MAGDRELKAMKSTLAALKALKPEQQQRVHRWLADKLGFGTPAPAGGGVGGGPTPPDSAHVANIKQFLKAKNPRDDVGRITALAYFLTHGKDLAVFKIENLNAARIEAALTSFNTSRALSNAQRTGYVTSAGERGSNQITAFGESLVDAMPDAEAVKKVKAEGRKSRRKPTGTKRASAKKTAAKKA